MKDWSLQKRALFMVLAPQRKKTETVRREPRTEAALEGVAEAVEAVETVQMVQVHETAETEKA